MPVKIGHIPEAAFKAQRLRGIPVLHQQPARMTDPYLDEKIIIRLVRHHLEIPAKGRDGEIPQCRNILQRNILFEMRQRIIIYFTELHRLDLIRPVKSIRRSNVLVFVRSR